MKFIFISILLLLIVSSQAQVHKVYIQSITIEGNQKTATNLILNELDVQQGDSLKLADLMPSIERNKQFLFNTTLFEQIQIKIAKWKGQNVQLKIIVKEFWYIFPIPQFELADRNFNVWWVQQKRDFRRANIGLWLLWRNISGYNDLLKTVVQLGYTRKFEIDYYLPPMGRKRKIGFGLNALYSDNKEAAYQTKDNQQVFYHNYDIEQRQFTRIRFRIRAYYRPRLRQTHRLGLSYLGLGISDSIRLFNPNFLGSGRTIQRSFNLQYTFELDRRDIKIYPLEGYYIHTELHKKGLGIFQEINQLYLKIHLSHAFKISKKWSVNSQIKARYNFMTSPVAYYQNRGLGYLDDYVRGYQYYVIDGQSFLLIQNDINFKLLDIKIPLSSNRELAYLQNLPFKIHLRYHIDFGYVWNYTPRQFSTLSNSDLVGMGLGVDFVLYNYNIIFQFEYSINKSGENGLYLRYKFHF